MRAVMLGLAFIAGLAGAADAQIRDPISSCKIDVDTLNFGNYSVISRTPLTSAGFVELRCGGNLVSADARVSLSAGSSGRFQQRTMIHSRDQLTYNIYVDPGRQMVAGDGSQGTSTLIPSPPHTQLKQFRGGLRTSSTAVFRFYGKIDPSQLVTAGEYVDTIVVTIEF